MENFFLSYDFNSEDRRLLLTCFTKSISRVFQLTEEEVTEYLQYIKKNIIEPTDVYNLFIDENKLISSVIHFLYSRYFTGTEIYHLFNRFYLLPAYLPETITELMCKVYSCLESKQLHASELLNFDFKVLKKIYLLMDYISTKAYLTSDESKKLLLLADVTKLYDDEMDVLKNIFIFSYIKNDLLTIKQALELNKRHLFAIQNQQVYQELNDKRIPVKNFLYHLFGSNRRNSTHTASVHESASEIAINLKGIYKDKLAHSGINEIVEYINNSLDSWSQLYISEYLVAVSKRCISRLQAIDSSIDAYRDQASDCSNLEFLAMFYFLILDQVESQKVKLDDAIKLFVDTLFQIQKGSSENILGEIIDNYQDDYPICPSGTFNKIAESASIYCEKKMVFVNEVTVGFKLNAVAIDIAAQYLRLKQTDDISTIWDSIKDEVGQIIEEEYCDYLSIEKLKAIIVNGEYINFAPAIKKAKNLTECTYPINNKLYIHAESAEADEKTSVISYLSSDDDESYLSSDDDEISMFIESSIFRKRQINFLLNNKFNMDNILRLKDRINDAFLVYYYDLEEHHWNKCFFKYLKFAVSNMRSPDDVVEFFSNERTLIEKFPYFVLGLYFKGEEINDFLNKIHLFFCARSEMNLYEIKETNTIGRYIITICYLIDVGEISSSEISSNNKIFKRFQLLLSYISEDYLDDCTDRYSAYYLTPKEVSQLTDEQVAILSSKISNYIISQDLTIGAALSFSGRQRLLLEDEQVGNDICSKNLSFDEFFNKFYTFNLPVDTAFTDAMDSVAKSAAGIAISLKNRYQFSYDLSRKNMLEEVKHFGNNILPSLKLTADLGDIKDIDILIDNAIECMQEMLEDDCCYIEYVEPVSEVHSVSFLGMLLLLLNDNIESKKISAKDGWLIMLDLLSEINSTYLAAIPEFLVQNAKEDAVCASGIFKKIAEGVTRIDQEYSINFVSLATISLKLKAVTMELGKQYLSSNPGESESEVWSHIKDEVAALIKEEFGNFYPEENLEAIIVNGQYVNFSHDKLNDENEQITKKSKLFR